MYWDEYRFFLVLARSPSVRAAADTLAVSHSTVLRKISRLEDRLGSRLFDRMQAGFQLTSTGEDVLKGVEEIEESVQGIDRTVTGRDSELVGRVRVSMPAVLAHKRLFPDVKAFQRRFPGIQLDVDLSYEVADLAKREADLAIRLTTTPPDDLVGRKLGTVALAPYASKSYLKTHQPLAEDSSAQLIAFGNPDKWVPDPRLAHLGVFGFYDDIFLQLDLVKLGAGVGILPTRICDKEPALARVAEPEKHFDLWVLYHADLRYTSRVRAVRDFLFESYSKIFEQY